MRLEPKILLAIITILIKFLHVNCIGSISAQLQKCQEKATGKGKENDNACDQDVHGYFVLVAFQYIREWIIRLKKSLDGYLILVLTTFLEQLDILDASDRCPRQLDALAPSVVIRGVDLLLAFPVPILS